MRQIMDELERWDGEDPKNVDKPQIHKTLTEIP